MTLDDQITEGYHKGIQRIGVIEVICGSMFSGKTEELMRRIKRALIAKLNVLVFKPFTDTRYHETNVVSHDQNSIAAIPVFTANEILDLVEDTDVVGIDEAQFLDEGIVEVCQTLADRGIRVIVSGLDLDFLRRPFGPMPALISIADRVNKVHAVCMDCGAPANYSYRLSKSDEVVMLGAKNEYLCLCRHCYLERSKKIRYERED
ncbi:MAG: thymidine kinase [Bacteroidales bacterium]|uniref:thymidine kinase n=1 Tax=Porphyromonas sp. TaxID=1924944 RepID=UPI00297317D5|nr:thymidine kinase [Porphyromonas sp.]MDD7438121.1 thymidine kinase [Bacteroidales bacterium]MDY3066337.1 thymidine kinase [Porphyromonas sp.]